MSHKLSDEQQLWLEQLYKKEYNGLLAFAQRHLSSPETVEDAVQEAYSIACAKIDELMNSPRPGGWLTEVLRRVIYRQIRTQMRAAAHFITTGDLDKRLIPAPMDNIVELDMAGVQALGKQNYYILKQVLLKELSIEEAARIMGVSTDTCRKRLERSKKKLRKKLERF